MATAKNLVAGVKEESGELLINTTWAEWLFGVTRKTLNEWADKGAPKADRGWWNPKAVLEWKGSATAVLDPEQYNEARKLKADIMYKEAKAAAAELALSAKRGEFLPRAEVEREFATRILEVKSILTGMGALVSSRFTDAEQRAEVRQVIESEFQRALEQYSRDGYLDLAPQDGWEGELVPEGEDGVETEGESDV